MLQSRITSAHNKECHITSNKHNIILHLCNDDHVIHQKQSTSKPIALPHLSNNTISLILVVPNHLTLAELHYPQNLLQQLRKMGPPGKYKTTGSMDPTITNV